MHLVGFTVEILWWPSSIFFFSRKVEVITRGLGWCKIRREVRLSKTYIFNYSVFRFLKNNHKTNDYIHREPRITGILDKIDE